MSSLSQSEPVEKRSSHGLAHFVDYDVVDREIDGNDTGADLAGIQPEDVQLEHFLALFAVADFTVARIAALIESRMAAREQPQL
jgi:hypothetical protein